MKNFTRCTVVTRFQNYAKMSFGLKFFLLFTQSCKFLDGALKRTIAAIKNNFLEREKKLFFDPLRSVFFLVRGSFVWVQLLLDNYPIGDRHWQQQHWLEWHKDGGQSGRQVGRTGRPGQAAAWQIDGRMIQLEINNNVVKSKLNWTLLAAAAVVFSKQGRS